MLDIKINGESLDLPDDIAIPVELNSPYFRDSQQSGSFTYPFTIPLTSKNKRISKFLGIIEAVLNTTEDIADIYVHGDLWKTGKIKFRESGEGISCELYFDDSAASESLSQKITDILEGLIQLLVTFPTAQHGSDEALFRLSLPGITYNHIFPPIANPTFFGTHTASTNPTYPYKGIINNFDTSIQKYIFYGSQAADYGESYQNTLCPQMYYKAVLEASLNFAGFNLIGSLFKDDELKQLLIYGNKSSDRNAPGSHTYEINIQDNAGRIKHCLPELSITQLMQGLETLFCAPAVIDYKNKTVSIVPFNDVLAKNAIINITQYSEEKAIIIAAYQQYKGYTFKFTQDPDDAGAHNGSINLKDFVRADDVDTYNDLGSLTPTGYEEIRFVKQQNQFYKANSLTVGDYVFLCDNYFDYKLDDGGQEILCPFQPIGMDYHFDMSGTGIGTPTGSGYGVIPSIQVQGKGWWPGFVLNQKNNPRIMFYRGMQLDSNPNYYPMASTFIYDRSGNQVGNYSLSWDGENGLVNTWHKQKINILKNSRLVRRKAWLPYLFYKNFSWDVKLRHNVSNYLVKNIKFTLFKNRIGAAEIEKYKLP